MTKKELIEKLEGLPDDTVIRIPEYYDETLDVHIPVSDVEIDCDGSNGCEAEVTLF